MRSEKIIVCLFKEEKELIKKYGILKGMEMSTFVREATLEMIKLIQQEEEDNGRKQ